MGDIDILRPTPGGSPLLLTGGGRGLAFFGAAGDQLAPFSARLDAVGSPPDRLSGGGGELGGLRLTPAAGGPRALDILDILGGGTPDAWAHYMEGSPASSGGSQHSTRRGRNFRGGSPDGSPCGGRSPAYKQGGAAPHRTPGAVRLEALLEALPPGAGAGAAGQRSPGAELPPPGLGSGAAAAQEPQPPGNGEAGGGEAGGAAAQRNEADGGGAGAAEPGAGAAEPGQAGAAEPDPHQPAYDYFQDDPDRQRVFLQQHLPAISNVRWAGCACVRLPGWLAGRLSNCSVCRQTSYETQVARRASCG